MKDAGAVAGSIQSERVAAAKYYAGGNYARFLNTYGQAVVNRADKFEDDIAVLNS
jgi:predicted trehalose synthase